MLRSGDFKRPLGSPLPAVSGRSLDWALASAGAHFFCGNVKTRSVVLSLASVASLAG